MGTANGAQRRFSLKWPAILLALVTLVGIAPIISVILSTSIASAFGCALDEGGVHPCIVYGHDIGETLTFMFVAGWFQLLLWPVVAVALVGWVVLIVVKLVRRAS